MKGVRDVIIIGAGPAGIAAAIQLARHGILPLVIEKEGPGGLLKNAGLVENYPGFPRGISGMKLTHLFAAQLGQTRAEVKKETAVRLCQEDGHPVIETDKDVHAARFIIAATGTRAKNIAGLDIPESVVGLVHHEVWTLQGERGKKIAIIGGGDAAFDYALSLSAGNDVVVLNRGARASCLPLLLDRARARGRIAYREMTQVESVSRTPAGGLSLGLSCQSGRMRIEADHLIIAAGREPELGIFDAALAADLRSRGSSGNIYLAGDVRNGNLRQAAIAAGNGIEAAMRIAQCIQGSRT